MALDTLKLNDVGGGNAITLERSDLSTVTEQIIPKILDMTFNAYGPAQTCYYFCARTFGEGSADFEKRKTAAMQFITDYSQRTTGLKLGNDLLDQIYSFCVLRWRADYHERHYRPEYLTTFSAETKLGLPKVGSDEQREVTPAKIMGWANKLKNMKRWKKIGVTVSLTLAISLIGVGALVESKSPGFISNIPSMWYAYTGNEQLIRVGDALINGAVPRVDNLKDSDIQRLESAFGGFSLQVESTPELTQLTQIPQTDIPTQADEPTETDEPTQLPTETGIPTETATFEPSATATHTPTQTQEPTSTATDEPTLTAEPSTPTFTPTSLPTLAPTSEPTDEPTALPTTEDDVNSVRDIQDSAIVTTLAESTPTLTPTEPQPTEPPATFENTPTMEFERTYSPYTYLKQSLLARLEQAEEWAKSDQEKLNVIRSLREKLIARERIVIDLILTDRAVYGGADNVRSYYSHGQEHIGNSDGMIQIILQGSDVFVVFFGRDLPARYWIDGQLGNMTTMEMLGSPRLNEPRNEDSTFKTYSDDLTGLFEAMTGLEGDLGLKISLGELNRIFGGLLPNGVGITLPAGIETPYVHFAPGVEQPVTGEGFVTLLRQRKAAGLNSYNRGSAVLKQILSYPGNISNLMTAANIGSFWNVLFSQDLSDGVQSFQVHGGSEAELLYALLGMMGGSDDSFPQEMIGLIANAAGSGNLSIITIQPPADGIDPIQDYRRQVAEALG